jgi:putative ABC transport system substrate-binding protein
MGLVQRRDFLIATAAVLALPLGAEAQQVGKVARIGVLGTTPPAAAVSFHAFQKGLQELGYVEGQHVHIDYRWPEGERAGYAALAAELVRGRFDVILTISAGAALAVKGATDAIPIVFCALGDDPVQLGMIASLARPGGNTTGTVILSRELEAKRLDLLKEAVPGLSRAAVLWSSSHPLHPRMLQDVEKAAGQLNVRVIRWSGQVRRTSRRCSSLPTASE